MAALTIQSTTKLQSGYEMPLLGFGILAPTTRPRMLTSSPNDVAEQIVVQALAAGYTHFDSAAAYGNEAGAAAAIRASGVARERVFFTSKVPPGAGTYAGARAAVAATLAATGFGYVDLMLLHAPYGGPAGRKGAWRALVEAVAAGTVRSVGVSNYGVRHLDELARHMQELEAEHGPGGGGVLSVGQWEIHPWLMRRDVVAWCRARGVAVQAYAPVVRGARWGAPALAAAAAAHPGVSEAQVLLRWSLQRGFVPLPKTVTPARVAENADLFRFALSDAELAALDTDDYAPVCWDPTVEPLER